MSGIRIPIRPLSPASADDGAGAAGAPTDAPTAASDRLQDCPATPNCVSTEGDPHDAIHFVAPVGLPDGMAPEAAMDAFEALVRSARRTEVLDRTPLRLRAIDRTAVFRFVDDVEARIDPDARLLHVRSASRVGRGDLGVNRRRVTAWLRELAEAWDVAWPPR